MTIDGFITKEKALKILKENGIDKKRVRKVKAFTTKYLDVFFKDLTTQQIPL